MPMNKEPGANLDGFSPEIEEALADFELHDVIARIWQKDHTAWKPEPVEITNRLGWLSVSDLMHDQITTLNSFARETQDAGFQKVVLLGVGGSSLGTEVLRQTFSSAEGYPDLVVLDSVVPSWVKSVADSLDPARTLFLISSKSGTTIETLVLFRYFKSLVDSVMERNKSGQNFVAITDTGTPLAELAIREDFRHIFLNPADIGGRYSVLSYFGLVPASLMGIDVSTLLDRADRMRQWCSSSVPLTENPGALLGVTIGALALKGKNKLTLITSPAISSFGLWVEQLIAESTGKDGTGIIPIAGEPLVESSKYGNDRIFIYLHLAGDNNSLTDATVEAIKSAQQPVLTLDMQDKYDLGAEFFRWEFATAVAGAILGINPFNQPDVQSAKDATQRLLQEYLNSGRLPQIEAKQSLPELLAECRKGDYLAIMAYIQQTTEVEDVLSEFRRKVVERYSIPVTFGYGPRFLHSTGQLHKGGPRTALFLQITEENTADLPIPSELYTFGVLAEAQALGDLQALQTLGRHVARIRLSQGKEAAINELLDKLIL